MKNAKEKAEAYYSSLPNSRVELVKMKNDMIGQIQGIKAMLESGKIKSDSKLNLLRLFLRVIDTKIAEVNETQKSIHEKFVDAAREMLDAELFYEILDAARNE